MLLLINWESIFFWCFIVTLVASILDTLGLGPYMISLGRLKCKLFATLIACIFDTLMFRLNMSCHITLRWRLINTLITHILYAFMFRLNMSCQEIMCCKLFVTVDAIILDMFIIVRVFCLLMIFMLYKDMFSSSSLFKDATMVGFWEKSQKSDQMPYFGQNLVGF